MYRAEAFLFRIFPFLYLGFAAYQQYLVGFSCGN